MIGQFNAQFEQEIRIAKNIDSQEETNKVLNTKRFITNRYNTRGF